MFVIDRARSARAHDKRTPPYPTPTPTPTPPSVRINTHHRIAGPGGGQRHRLDLQLVAHAANSRRGTGYSGATMNNIRSVMAQRPNFHNYNSHRQNHWERSVVNDLISAHRQGHTVQVTSREATHLREGATFLRQQRNNLPRGMVNQLRQVYGHAVDHRGRRVLDGRQWRGW